MTINKMILATFAFFSQLSNSMHLIPSVWLTWLLPVILFSEPCFTQFGGGDLPATDTLYDHKIQSIFLYRNFPEKESLPFLVIGQQGSVQLEFDYLIPSPEELYYSIFHFNKNWQPDELQSEEFIKGFQEEKIYSYSTSRNTKVPFVHYQLSLSPGQFLVSGNYLICVYTKQKEVLFTRRLLISEQLFNCTVDFVSPFSHDSKRTHQSLEISVKTHDVPVANNDQELFLQVLQNGDYNTLRELKSAHFVKADGFDFNRPDELLFEARKEFRFKDIRTLVSRTPDIQYWDEKEDGYHAWLIPDEIRAGRNYYTENDINGKFLILNRDVLNPVTESDYAWMHFTLKTGYELDYPVYLYGAVSDWQLKDEFILKYDDSRKAYTGQYLLKLGYYNYLYAYRDDAGKVQTEDLEGNWYETENQYMIMVYYRPFGSRYDRLMFVGQFNSNL